MLICLGMMAPAGCCGAPGTPRFAACPGWLAVVSAGRRARHLLRRLYPGRRGHTEEAAMITGISIVAVPVDDIEEALRFYCELLGMEKRKDLRGARASVT